MTRGRIVTSTRARPTCGWLAEGAAFAAAPGTVFEYSNLGYGVLGQVVEAVAGIRLQEYVSRQLLGPLGMGDTVWDAEARTGTRLARPFRVVDGEIVADAPPLADGALGPMGGLWSTVADLALWVGFLAEAFPPRDGTDDGPLRRASRREMQQVARAIPASITREEVDGRLRLVAGGYGMGLEVREHLELGAMVTHSGGLPGFGSNMRWLRERGVGVVALANLTYPPMGLFTRDALELLQSRGALPRGGASAGRRARRGRPRPGRAPLGWDTPAPRRLFADNVLLDDPLDRRRPPASRAPRAARRAVGRTGRRGPRHARATPSSPASAGACACRSSSRRWPRRRVQRYDGTSIVPASAALIGPRAPPRRSGRRPGPGRRWPRCSRPGADAVEARAATRRRAHPVRPPHRRRGRGRRRRRRQGGERATLRWHGERGDLDVDLRLHAGRLRIERLAPRPLPDP